MYILTSNYSVRVLVGCLTVSRAGVSDAEMEELLSLDESVMDEQMHANDMRTYRLPQHLWTRLRSALAPYLLRVADYSLVASASSAVGEAAAVNAHANHLWRWRFALCRDVVEERYINKDKATTFHKLWVDFLTGTR